MFSALRLVVATTASCVMLFSTGLQAETLREALVATQKNSTAIKASRARLRSQMEGVEQARAPLRPQLNLVSSVNHRYPVPDALTASIELALDLLVYDGGTQQLAIQIEQANTSIAKQMVVQTEQAAYLETIRAYFGVLQNQQNLALELENQEIIQTQLNAARERFAVGEIARSEVDLVEARLAQIRSSVAQLRGQLSIARESYKLSTGQYPDQLETSQPQPEIPASLDDAMAIANRMHPAIQNAKLAVKIADLNIDRVRKAARSPKVTLRAAVGGNRLLTSGQSFEDTWSIQLGGQVPLYAGGLRSSHNRQAVANSDAARHELHRIAASVLADATNAWTQLDILDSIIAASREQVEYSRTAFEGVQVEANLGLRSTLDVLDAERDFREAQTRSTNAVLDRNIARYALLASIGQLTAGQLGL
ncbi:MAG: TolC family outer membrane protein [Rhodobacteraceae bacterium]|nr:TolC family outer membrane protein [Paracoccaceae bacterium]